MVDVIIYLFSLIVVARVVSWIIIKIISGLVGVFK